MKTFKAICAASVIAFSLSIPAYAGDGHTPGSPCPVSGSIETPTTAPGDISSPAFTSTDPGDISSPGFADILLALISLF